MENSKSKVDLSRAHTQNGSKTRKIKILKIYLGPPLGVLDRNFFVVKFFAFLDLSDLQCRGRRNKRLTELFSTLNLKVRPNVFANLTRIIDLVGEVIGNQIQKTLRDGCKSCWNEEQASERSMSIQSRDFKI